MIFSANLLTDEKHPVFWTNHLANIDRSRNKNNTKTWTTMQENF